MSSDLIRGNAAKAGLLTCLCLIGCGPLPESSTMIVTADQSVYVTGNPDIKGLPVYGANISGNMDHYITGTSYYDIGTVSSFLGTTSSAGTPAYPLGEFSVPNAEMPAVWDVTWETIQPTVWTKQT